MEKIEKFTVELVMSFGVETAKRLAKQSLNVALIDEEPYAIDVWNAVIELLEK